MNKILSTDFAWKSFLLLPLILVLMSSISCDVVLSEAKGVVSSVRLENDVTSDSQGNPDYAVTVYSTIENVGKEGKIQVTYTLTSSEGDWSRVDDLYFRAGETRSLTKLFSEPTIRATNIRAYVDVYPKPTNAS